MVVKKLPTADDIFGALNGGEFFTLIDLTEADLQVPIDEESQETFTVSITKGLYKVKRLPFGVKS